MSPLSNGFRSSCSIVSEIEMFSSHEENTSVHLSSGRISKFSARKSTRLVKKSVEISKSSMSIDISTRKGKKKASHLNKPPAYRNIKSSKGKEVIYEKIK